MPDLIRHPGSVHSHRDGQLSAFDSGLYSVSSELLNAADQLADEAQGGGGWALMTQLSTVLFNRRGSIKVDFSISSHSDMESASPVRQSIQAAAVEPEVLSASVGAG
jgi:hypothetical protein